MNFQNIRKKIIVNTSSQIAGKAASVILGFLTVGLLTRYLGVSGYGVYTLVFAYLAFFSTFSDFGLQLSLVRDVSKDGGVFSELKRAYFSLKILLTVISAALALIGLFFFPYSSFIKQAIIIGAVAVFAGQLNAYGAAVLQSRLKLHLVALLEIINRMATVLVIVIFVLLRLNLFAILSAVLIGNVISLILHVYLEPTFYRINFSTAFPLIRKLFRGSFIVGITSILAVFYFKLDTILLSLLKGEQAVGLYSLAYKIFENILMVWGFYMASAYPVIASYIGRKDNAGLKKILRVTAVFLIGFSAIVILVGYIAAPLAVQILGGKEFSLSVFPFRILLLSIPFVLTNNVLYYVFLSYSRAKHIVIVLTISLVFNFLVNLAVIPRFGIVGTSLSTVATELITCLLYLVMCLKIKPTLKLSSNG